jgi:hypothetical protein
VIRVYDEAGKVIETHEHEGISGTVIGLLQMAVVDVVDCSFY